MQREGDRHGDVYVDTKTKISDKNVYCMANVLCGTYYAENGSSYLLSLIYSTTESGRAMG